MHLFAKRIFISKENRKTAKAVADLRKKNERWS